MRGGTQSSAPPYRGGTIKRRLGEEEFDQERLCVEEELGPDGLHSRSLWVASPRRGARPRTPLAKWSPARECGTTEHSKKRIREVEPDRSRTACLRRRHATLSALTQRRKPSWTSGGCSILSSIPGCSKGELSAWPGSRSHLRAAEAVPGAGQLQPCHTRAA